MLAFKSEVCRFNKVLLLFEEQALFFIVSGLPYYTPRNNPLAFFLWFLS